MGVVDFVSRWSVVIVRLYSLCCSLFHFVLALCPLFDFVVVFCSSLCIVSLRVLLLGC